MITNINFPYQKIEIKDILDGIIYVAELGVPITIGTMLTRESIYGYTKLIKFLDDNNLFRYNNITLKLINPINYSSKYTIDESFFTLSEYKDLFNYMKKILKNLNKQKFIIHPLQELNVLSSLLFRKSNYNLTHLVSSCDWNVIGNYSISPDGKIYWCTCVEEGKYPIGQFRPNVIIFKDKEAKIRNRNVFTLKECRKCNFKYICGGGCPLFNIKRGERIDKNYCGIFKNDFVMNNLESFLCESF